MQKWLILWFVFVLATDLRGQDTIQKIGHADWQYIVSQLPEFKQIESELKTFETHLRNQLTSKTQELDAKYNAYESLPKNSPEAIRKDKESEISFLEENLEKFRRDAQASIQKKQGDLLAPVLDKVQKSIDAVARENGYSFIFSPRIPGGGEVLLFATNKDDVSNLVLKKLGITPPVKSSSPE